MLLYDWADREKGDKNQSINACCAAMGREEIVDGGWGQCYLCRHRKYFIIETVLMTFVMRLVSSVPHSFLVSNLYGMFFVVAFLIISGMSRN